MSAEDERPSCLYDDLVEASLRLGMFREEAERAARDAVERFAWRLRRGAKECASCREEKPVREFGRDASRRDGLAHYCRDCRRVNGESVPT